jgi:hypothetical protein
MKSFLQVAPELPPPPYTSLITRVVEAAEAAGRHAAASQRAAERV